MKKAVLLAVVLSAATLVAGEKGKSWTGTVSDAMCGKKHVAGMSDRDCTLACVKKGQYALVVGDKVYTLEGKTAGLEEFAGGKAKVTGNLSGETITVESAAAVGKAEKKS